MGIRAALTQLTSIQTSLSITDPYAVSVVEAYRVPPSANQTISPPCWVNAVTITGLETPGQSYRRQRFTVTMDFYAAPTQPDLAVAEDVALAFYEAFIAAFALKVNLNGTVSVATLRGNDPSLVVLERGQGAFAGLRLHLDCLLGEAVAFSV